MPRRPGPNVTAELARLMFPLANGVPLRYPPIATWALIANERRHFSVRGKLSPSELTEFLYRFALVPARYFEAGNFGSSLSLSDYLPFA